MTRILEGAWPIFATVNRRACPCIILGLLSARPIPTVRERRDCGCGDRCPVLCLWGSFESYGFESKLQQQYRDPYQVAAQFTRLEPALASIPENAETGYITDAPAGGVTDTAMFLGAQYVLAPRLLKRGTAQAWVLGNFTRPADFAALGQAQGLRLQQDFGQGVVLFRKER